MAQNRQKKRGNKRLAGYHFCGGFEWVSDGVCVRGEIWVRDDKPWTAEDARYAADKAKLLACAGNPQIH